MLVRKPTENCKRRKSNTCGMHFFDFRKTEVHKESQNLFILEGADTHIYASLLSAIGNY